MNRRDFLGTAGSLAALPAIGRASVAARTKAEDPKFKLGTITYNVAEKWDVATLLKVCEATKYEYVELRTSHAHKVEPSIGADQRRDVKKQFEDAGIRSEERRVGKECRS